MRTSYVRSPACTSITERVVTLTGSPVPSSVNDSRKLTSDAAVCSKVRDDTDTRPP